MPMNVLDPEKGLEAEIFAEENRRNNASGRFLSHKFVIPLIESFRHSSIGRGPGGFDRKFSEFSSSRVSQTSTGATTARLLSIELFFCLK